MSAAPRVRLWLRASEASGVTRARRAVAAYCESTVLTDDRRNDVALAVTEACTNCVLHAYDGHADGSRYLVGAYTAGDQVVVTVEDWGVGITAADNETSEARPSAGLGLGLTMIRKLASRVEVGSALGRGTRIEMRFDLH
jgi:anti-sigma regulatory factor (Ser/Thr protein kinase)